MFVRLIRGLSIVLTTCSFGIHCALSTQQFVFVVSNITVLPNENVAFTEELLNESAKSLRCPLKCAKNPNCFIYCHTVDGTCIIGQHETYSDENIFSNANFSSSVTSGCYIKRQYFDLSPEGNALLVGNESAARNKSSKHSSVYGQFVSNFAIDGDRHAVFWDPPKTCFHSVDSSQDAHPYMVIDMIATYLVIAFNITNRSDGSIKRLHDLEIRVGFYPYNINTNAVFQQNSLCLAYDNVVDSLFLFRNCDEPVAGRYISLQIVRYCPVTTNAKCIQNEGDKNVLCICELDIFALMIGQ